MQDAWQHHSNKAYICCAACAVKLSHNPRPSAPGSPHSDSLCAQGTQGLQVVGKSQSLLALEAKKGLGRGIKPQESPEYTQTKHTYTHTVCVCEQASRHNPGLRPDTCTRVNGHAREHTHTHNMCNTSTATKGATCSSSMPNCIHICPIYKPQQQWQVAH